MPSCAESADRQTDKKKISPKGTTHEHTTARKREVAKATCALKIGIGRALNRANMFAMVVGPGCLSGCAHLLLPSIFLLLLRAVGIRRGGRKR